MCIRDRSWSAPAKLGETEGQVAERKRQIWAECLGLPGIQLPVHLDGLFDCCQSWRAPAKVGEVCGEVIERLRQVRPEHVGLTGAHLSERLDCLFGRC